MTGHGVTIYTPEQRALAEALVDILVRRHALATRGVRQVITVAGESGSGKTVTALSLVHALTARGIRTDVLHQDDYFFRPPAANHAQRVRDLTSVGPHEVDLARLSAHADAFRAAAKGVIVPRVIYAEDRFEETTRDFSDVDLLIVEGTYVIAHTSADVRIFLSATSDDTRERRRLRNRDIDAPIVDAVLAIEHPIIASQAALADIVIDRDFHIARP